MVYEGNKNEIDRQTRHARPSAINLERRLV